MIDFTKLSKETQQFITERAKAMGVTIEEALKHYARLFAGKKVSKHLHIFA